MSKTKTLNKTVSTVLILLLTLSILSVINVNIIPQILPVKADDMTVPSQGIMVNTTGFWRADKNFYATSTPIKDAIENATSPDLNITVTAGIYNTTSELTITKEGLTLKSAEGAESTIINSTTTNTIMNIQADDVIIDGFTFNGTEKERMGIYCIPADNFTIRNNKFIELINSANINVESTNKEITLGLIDNNTFIGEGDNSAHAISLNANNPNNCSGVTVSNNIISNFTDDVGIQPSSSGDARLNNLTITGNTVTDCSRGFYPYQAWGDNWTVTGNTFSRCKTGIKINYGTPTNLNITGNNIADNTEMGIQIFNWSDTNVIYYNNIYNNTLYGIKNTNDTSVNATLNWWGIDTGPSGDASGDGDAVSTNVNYDPWLGMYSKSITPVSVKGNVVQLFNVTVTNTGSNPAIGYINVTYPSGWIYKGCTTPVHWCRAKKDGNTLVFQADSGYYLSNKPTPQNVTLGLNMNATGDGNWTVSCKNDRTPPEEGYLPPPLEVLVDSQKPEVAIPTLPTYYSVGAGNKIWINGTITDGTHAKPSVAINDTEYFPQNPQVLEYNETASSAGSYVWYFRFYNTSAVPDDYLAVNVTGTDAAGNAMLPSEAIEANATIDNTDPTLIDYKLVVADNKIGNLTRTDDTFYMSAEATGLNFTVMFSEAHPCTNVTYISNGTVTTTAPFKNNTWFYIGDDEWYNVTDIDEITILNITITDLAQPNNNTLEVGPYTILRDREGPHDLEYDVTEICGGLIIKNLNATDNVKVNNYEVYVNGSSFLNVTVTKLANTTLDWITTTDATADNHALNRSCVFDGTLVLNLTNYAGGHANLTIKALDVGGNPSNYSTPHTYNVSEGQWYPIELQPKWNLISLPLIPNSTARTDILSLVLKQGPSGVIVTHGYNQTIDDWITDPAEMTDGWGYWLYMSKYDVLIVQGRETPEPPALPPTYEFTEGWVLGGFKSTTTLSLNTTSGYLGSLEDGSYFPYIYVWNATIQDWEMRAITAANDLNPGEGFWIWMYKDQHLIPPI